ncbi:sigma-54-dependent transcriptional regulator [Gracilinema caldarium]|uniref:Two component, sigma54 specific, transcriptional regulator, Fis family n=1 Tax=Gracilinema caldarium (strain ATCC 51460 / DSM 7334 / H1) TaxID=744872 RepID=F8F2K3_GRAC1|nr:sigma-54 dependent transcriptional regulator [Gracilinema caldarium]AEJ19118.1 two component, sigma54 specific, transcriptional regulator, Fis family [Gracilinema caldarium DSM 7334]
MSDTPIAVLVLDDETRLAEEIGEYLESKGFSVYVADKPSKAFQIIHANPIQIAMVDIKLPEYDGLTFLKKLQAEQSIIETIIMSGHGDMESVIEALRLGAFDYLRKPFTSLELEAAINRISRFLDVQQNYRRFAKKCMELEDQIYSGDDLIGKSPIIIKIREEIERAAQFPDVSVLIRGESGTGKELVARSIHRKSNRSSGSFVPVNCAAIPREMFESEFFGHAKGAFTDAQTRRDGLFKAADGGTLFLDEVGEIPIELQAKLLRVLEDKRVRPVGMDREIPTDVRVIGATNRDLLEEVRQGRFRKDLYYRLNVMDMYIPPLRERSEDIPELASFFYKQASLRSGRLVEPLDETLFAILSQYYFPGNIRELKNLMERIVILGRKPSERDLMAWLDPEHCGCFKTFSEPGFNDPALHLDLPVKKVSLRAMQMQELNLEQLERNAIQVALQTSRGNLSAAARLLGITRQALDRRMKKYGLQ